MKAKGNWIIVCRAPITEDILPSGIILTCNIETPEFFEAKVISVGNYCEEDIAIHAGDSVLVRNTGCKIEIGRNKPGIIFAVEDDDILCVLGDDE